MTLPGRRVPGPRVPFALRLAARLLPAEVRAEVLGDLLEHWRRDVRQRGLLGRVLWAWRQPLSAIATRYRFGRTPGAGRPGHTPRLTEQVRRSRLGISWLDLKLGLRMLLKYPGLTMVVGFTLAVGIPVGLYPLHLMSASEAPLPFDESERVMVLRQLTEVPSDRRRVPFQDFTRWRDGLTSFRDIGATTIGLSYNVMSEDGRAAPVRGARMTASAFDILRARPLLGRTLVAADEMTGATDVVVISHDLWESRLGNDPDVVGRDVRIGGVTHTVVGVMPEGFLFPVRDHLWLPLRVDELEERADAAGPVRVIFGRLADGVSQEEAEAELSALGPRVTAESTDAARRRRPEVVRLAIGLTNQEKGGLRGDLEFYYIQGIVLLVLFVACANVEMLIFARTTTRTSELAVRTALGASRARVVSQLFTESFVLAALAAGAGLLIGDRVLLPLAGRFLPPDLPYWLDFGVTGETVVGALTLAVLSAAVAGVVPALKATGKAVHGNMQRAAAGRSGIRFGGVSSALIVLDVALAVTTVAFAIVYSNGFAGFEDDGAGTAGAFLSAELTVPRAVGVQTATLASTEYSARVAHAQRELVRRLEAEPRVLGVTMADVLPGMDHRMRAIEVDGDAAGDAAGHRVATARVAPGFFDAFDHPVVSGRAFDLADLGEGSTAVIVNTDFVEHVLDGRNAIGRRVRYRARSGEEPWPWYEVVGVVGRLGTVGLNTEPLSYQALYRPLAPGGLPSVRLAVRVGNDVEAFAPRLRSLAGEVDPAAIVSDPRPLDEVVSFTRLGQTIVMSGAGILLGILVALSASGIYALMSFTITERRREIGIRTALGADRGRIVSAVAKRAVAQLGAGVLLGMPLAAWLLSQWDDLGYLEPDPKAGSALVLTVVLTLAVAAGAMLVIGALACTAPTLRALRIAPTEALREGG